MNASPRFLVLLSLSVGATPGLAAGSVAYWTHGDANAETIVLVHGFNSSHATWKTLVPELAKRYRVVVYDQPGHGASKADGTDYTPRKMAERLVRLLDELKLPRAHVLGHSMGGRVAIELAARFPQRVTSVVVEDMHLQSIPHAVTALPAIRAKYEKVRAAIPDSFASVDEARVALSAFYDVNETAFILAAGRLGPDGRFHLGNRPEVTNLYLAEGLALDMTAELEAIHAPLAFFAGDARFEQTVLKGEGLRHIRRHRPDAVVREFKGSGHSIHGSQAFLDELLALLPAPLTPRKPTAAATVR